MSVSENTIVFQENRSAVFSTVHTVEKTEKTRVCSEKKSFSERIGYSLKKLKIF